MNDAQERPRAVTNRLPARMMILHDPVEISEHRPTSPGLAVRERIRRRGKET
jgi:hypothetical protein